MTHALAALLFGVIALLASPPAQAQLDTREGIALNNAIAELRHDLQELREQVARGGAASASSLGGYRGAPPPAGPSDLTAQLLERVSQLEDEVRRLHGRIDELDNTVHRQGEDLQKQIGDLNFKLDGATGGGARPASSPPPAQVLVPPPVPPPAVPTGPVRRTPEMALQEGNAALARRDYAAAEAAAREVLSGPVTPRSADANFLLALSLAGRKQWDRAAVAYDDTYNRAKNGARAQDALVGLAVALTNLNEKAAACQTLERLRAQFPSPRGDLRETIAATRARAGCR